MWQFHGYGDPTPDGSLWGEGVLENVDRRSLEIERVFYVGTTGMVKAESASYSAGW